jgi:hypothetical protein
MAEGMCDGCWLNKVDDSQMQMWFGVVVTSVETIDRYGIGRFVAPSWYILGTESGYDYPDNRAAANCLTKQVGALAVSRDPDAGHR